MPTIREMREVCQPRKKNAKGKMIYAGNWFNARVTRHFSIYFTWLFVKGGVSANSVTLLMFFATWLGTALVVPHVPWANILGAIVLFLGMIFDCADGEVARWTKTSSIKGVFLDLVYHVVCEPVAFAVLPLHLFVWSGDRTFLYLAFAMSATCQCILGLDYAVAITEYRAGSPPSGEPGESPSGQGEHATRKTILGLLRSINLVLGRGFARIVVQLVSMLGIILIYVGAAQVALLFVCCLLAMGALRVAVIPIGKYFWGLPNQSHKKIW